MPYWCDMDCPDAEFVQEEGMDGSNSCRTFLAVFCRKHQTVNMKNALCIDQKTVQQKISSPSDPVLKKTAGNTDPSRPRKL